MRARATRHTRLITLLEKELPAARTIRGHGLTLAVFPAGG